MASSIYISRMYFVRALCHLHVHVDLYFVQNLCALTKVGTVLNLKTLLTKVYMYTCADQGIRAKIWKMHKWARGIRPQLQWKTENSKYWAKFIRVRHRMCGVLTGHPGLWMVVTSPSECVCMRIREFESETLRCSKYWPWWLLGILQNASVLKSSKTFLRSIKRSRKT